MKQASMVFIAAAAMLLAVPAWAGGFDRWAEALAVRAEREAPTLQTTEDADGWGRVIVQLLYREFFSPTVGQVETGAYGVSMRDYRGEDLHIIARATERMMAILKQVHARVAVNGYENHLANLERMLQGIKAKSTPAGRYQQDMLQRLR